MTDTTTYPSILVFRYTDDGHEVYETTYHGLTLAQAVAQCDDRTDVALYVDGQLVRDDGNGGYYI